MEFPRKKDIAAAATTKQAGDAAEDRALAHLLDGGLKLLARNYRTPGRGGGEIDLVMRDRAARWSSSRCASAPAARSAAPPPA